MREFSIPELYIVKSAELTGISDYKHTHLHLFYILSLSKFPKFIYLHICPERFVRISH